MVIAERPEGREATKYPLYAKNLRQWPSDAPPGDDAPPGSGAPPGPVVARLDTGGRSGQTFSENGKTTDKDNPGDREESRQGKRQEARQKEKEHRQKSRRRKCGYHAELMRLLREMESGQHGFEAEWIASRWVSKVGACPGMVKRHRPCDKKVFLPHRCDFSLCPWEQARRSTRLHKVLGPLVGKMLAPKLWTFNPPNIEHLTGGAVSALGQALTNLHRLTFLAGSETKEGLPCKYRVVRGGIRSIEVTKNGKGKGWNLHAHEAVDAGWVAHYPQTDFVPGKKGKKGQWLKRPWVVVKRHPGLAREFTRECQAYPELANLGYCKDGRSHASGHEFDACPGCWYFVDLRTANKGVAKEVAKYVVKGSQVVNAGADAVVDYLHAMKGKRLVQPFGNLYKVKLEIEEEEDLEDAYRPGECPWADCPRPRVAEWIFVGLGFPEFGVLEHDKATGSFRVRDGPPT